MKPSVTNNVIQIYNNTNIVTTKSIVFCSYLSKEVTVSLCHRIYRDCYHLFLVFKKLDPLGEGKKHFRACGF